MAWSDAARKAAAETRKRHKLMRTDMDYNAKAYRAFANNKKPPSITKMHANIAELRKAFKKIR